MFKHVTIKDEKLFENTLIQWKKDATTFGEFGIFLESEVEQRLLGLKHQITKEADFHCYFLVKDGEDFASSLIEVSHAMPRSENPWLKLFNITLRPYLLPSIDGNVNNLTDTLRVITFSITHTLELMFKDHEAQKLKIFGRTTEMIIYFQIVAEGGHLDEILDILHLEAKIEGRWLVLSKIA